MKPINPHWKTCQLGDVAKVISGFAFKSSEFIESGVPVIKISNVRDRLVDLSDPAYVDDSYLSIDKRYHVCYGDILISLTGSHLSQPNSVVGRVARFTFRGFPCLLNQRAGKVIVQDDSRCDAAFLYFLLCTSEKRHVIALKAHGAANQANVSPSQVESIELLLPSARTQRKIAGVLSAYDDLIENNTRRIAILEEMAQAIYREWFVNFRFPGHEKVKLINSPLGEIPEGWAVGVINDVLRLLSGFAFKSETFVDDGEYRLVTIKNVHDGRFVEESDSLLDAIPDKMPDHCHLSSGDILLSLTGNIGRTCIVYGSGFLLNQRVAKLSPLNSADKGYVYSLFRNPDTQLRLSNIANGVAQQNLSPVQTGQLPHPLPPRSLLDAFAGNLTPIFWNIVQLYRKNSNLRKTRDLLLPKLISGQLDVEELDIDTGESAVADASGSDLVCSDAVSEGAERSEPQASTPTRKKQS